MVSVAAVGVLAPTAVAVDVASHSPDGVPTPIVSHDWSDYDREFVLQTFGEKPRRWRVRTCELSLGTLREYFRASDRVRRASRRAAPVIRTWDREERVGFDSFASVVVYSHCEQRQR